MASLLEFKLLLSFALHWHQLIASLHEFKILLCFSLTWHHLMVNLLKFKLLLSFARPWHCLMVSLLEFKLPLNFALTWHCLMASFYTSLKCRLSDFLFLSALVERRLGELCTSKMWTFWTSSLLCALFWESWIIFARLDVHFQTLFF